VNNGAPIDGPVRVTPWTEKPTGGFSRLRQHRGACSWSIIFPLRTISAACCPGKWRLPGRRRL
jgi:hypothetical protein